MMLHRAESAPAPELTLMGEDLRRAADDVSRSCFYYYSHLYPGSFPEL